MFGFIVVTAGTLAVLSFACSVIGLYFTIRSYRRNRKP